jgi:hypothetical protein
LRDPGQLHAVRIDPKVSATAARTYLANRDRWTPAEEMPKSDFKTGHSGSRTPFQILQLIAVVPLVACSRVRLAGLA